MKDTAKVSSLFLDLQTPKNLQAPDMSSVVNRGYVIMGQQGFVTRHKTPIPSNRSKIANSSLSALESALRVANVSSPQLPELLPAANSFRERSVNSILQAVTDNVLRFAMSIQCPVVRTSSVPLPIEVREKRPAMVQVNLAVLSFMEVHLGEVSQGQKGETNQVSTPVYPAL